jgi:hypothetical protein
VVPAGEGLVTTIAKEAVELFEFQTTDASNFEFEEGVLPEIHIHRMDAVGIIESVIQGVASGRGYEHDVVVAFKIHDLPIQTGILPAAVINQMVAVYVGEDLLGCPVGNSFHKFFRMSCEVLYNEPPFPGQSESGSITVM